MNIYTRTGDQGKTSLIGGRLHKNDAQIEAYGTIDELNSYVGQAYSMMDLDVFQDMREQFLEIQHELFDCGSDLAYVQLEEDKYKVSAAMIERLEQWIDAYESTNPPLERFILPGGTMLSSTLHVCRTVCRRAERRTVTLAEVKAINPYVLSYLNRLSDYFFAAGRAANLRSGVSDVEYIRSQKVFKTGK